MGECRDIKVEFSKNVVGETVCTIDYEDFKLLRDESELAQVILRAQQQTGLPQGPVRMNIINGPARAKAH
jgi:hypothetical protein